MADGLASSVFPGTEVNGVRPLGMRRYPVQQNTPLFLTRRGGDVMPVRAPYVPPIAPPAARYNPVAPLSVTQTPKSQSQNQFLSGVKNTMAGAAPSKAQSLTQFVKEAYAAQGQNKQALQQETAALDKIFSTQGGLVNELADARAKRKAGVMMNTKLALDRARRGNNLSRMMSGNNSYNDRLYAQMLANVGANEAIAGAERESDDLRYLTNTRLGATGRRGALSNSYLDSLLNTNRGVNASARDDLSVLEQIAQMEDRNSVYETPLMALQREMAMRDGLAGLESYQ